MENKIAGDASFFLKNLTGKTILGVNPPVYDFAWFDLWSKPIGLLGLLNYLRSRGNKVHLLDCLYEGRTQPLSFGRWKVESLSVPKPAVYRDIPRIYRRFGVSCDILDERLRALPKPDIILVTSAMTYWYPGVFEAVQMLKNIYPEVPVILGGTYARLCPEHACTSGADFIQTERFALPVDSPALDLYDHADYGILTTSWGCPMRCDYCASRTLWGDFKRRPLEDIFNDLRQQATLEGVQDAAFYDDALLIGKEHCFYPLCAYIQKHFPQLRLHTPNGLHVAQLDDQCCRVLFQSGFHTIRLSLEGVDRFTKGVSSDKAGESNYVRAFSSLLRAGYPAERVETYILVGLPGQSVQNVEASIDFVRSLGGNPKLAEFSPIPGTPLYEKALELVPHLSVEPLLQNNTVFASHIAHLIEPDELQALKDKAKGR